MHQAGGPDYRCLAWFTNSAIDLTRYSTLYFDMKYDYNWNRGWPIKFGVTTKKGYSVFGSSSNNGTAYANPSTSNDRRTISVDVSGINDSRYIGFSNNGRVWVYNIWLE